MAEIQVQRTTRMQLGSGFRLKTTVFSLLINLIILGCNTEAKLAFGKACLEGNAQGVQAALTHGANPNWSIGPTEMSPLMLAACGIEVSHPNLGLKSDPLGRVAIIKSLLSRNANPKKKNSGGYGTLFYAVIGNLPQGCRLLIDAGAPPWEVEKSGFSPIHFAASEGKPECLEQLILGLPSQTLEIRTTSNEPGVTERTALMIAAHNGHNECVRILLKAGASKNSADKIGTPLTYAAMDGHLEVVETLLQAGSKVDEPAGNGSTPLKKAAYSGHLDLVLFLISQGAQVNATDKHGRTALMEAAYRGHKDIVACLLKSGASIGLTNDKGHKAVDLALSSNHPEVAELITQWK